MVLGVSRLCRDWVCGDGHDECPVLVGIDVDVGDAEDVLGDGKGIVDSGILWGDKLCEGGVRHVAFLFRSALLPFKRGTVACRRYAMAGLH